ASGELPARSAPSAGRVAADALLRGPSPDEGPAVVVMGASVERVQGGDPLPTEELRSVLESSVVHLGVRACGVRRQATATMLRAGGAPVGLTAGHAVRGARSATLSGAGLGVAEGRVEGHLQRRDAALVDLSGLGAPPGAGLPTGPPPAVGDEVTVAGFPGGAWQVESGAVLERSSLRISGGPVEVFVVDVPALRGASGGVVVDASGAAVGLVTELDPRTGHAVAQSVEDLLGAPVSASPPEAC
ncbi:MAG: serine protease, partial [Microthrixaceae bacterium]